MPLINKIYDTLPLTERTFRKNLQRYPYIIANDGGHPCEWYFYHNKDRGRRKPFGMVKYYKGRKLVCFQIIPREV